MRECAGTSRMVQWRAVAILVFILSLVFAPALAEENSTFGQRLILNVYLDDSGKALVTGYADNTAGLLFLNSSQYRYENETSQLYALTDELTTKVGDLWTIRFDAIGSYDDYHVTFYLPSDMRLGNIDISSGLGYLLSASNESLVADVQGYEVHSPVISIDYQQSLEANRSMVPLPPPPGNIGNIVNFSLILAAFALIIALLAVFIFMRRRKDEHREMRANHEEKSIGSVAIIAAPPKAASPESSDQNFDQKDLAGTEILAKDATPRPEDLTDDGVYSTAASDSSPAVLPPRIVPSGEVAAKPLPTNTLQTSEQPLLPPVPAPSDPNISRVEERAEENGVDEGGASLADESDQTDAIYREKPGANRAQSAAIVISSEMEAVMQTLTARERAVLTTLIDHGGRMTQADIRYETGTPKSSLTGILISLERRKLVTKKEWGRTNIIELSEWFLSKKERS
jgi:uncharacterized membrane protein